MPIDRRIFSAAALALAAAPLLPRDASAATVGDNGLHTQPFFLDTFLDLGEDLAEAQAEGKGLAVFFEQRGCPYCKEMHEVNLSSQKVLDTILPHFNFVQLDIWGSREVTDFDGEAIEERELAQRWGVNFTPTISFFAEDTQADGTQGGRMLEAARMPGYFKPFHFVSMFEFVAGGQHKDMSFQRFLQDKFADYETRGEKPDVW
ncbi:thioredoxin family protein [Tepidamorphus sp. 3E244]|uniref:thioredoxin family protein n=1 Tax=Tepidamorphus sp. 3E244 TaxID=3385498 RepID=UPI0038FC1ECC